VGTPRSLPGLGSFRMQAPWRDYPLVGEGPGGAVPPPAPSTILRWSNLTWSPLPVAVPGTAISNLFIHPSLSMQRIYRSRKERVLAGVCGGIGIAADVDPSLVRLALILLTLVSLVGGPVPHLDPPVPGCLADHPLEPEAGRRLLLRLPVEGARDPAEKPGFPQFHRMAGVYPACWPPAPVLLQFYYPRLPTGKLVSPLDTVTMIILAIIVIVLIASSCGSSGSTTGSSRTRTPPSNARPDPCCHEEAAGHDRTAARCGEELCQVREGDAGEGHQMRASVLKGTQGN